MSLVGYHCRLDSAGSYKMKIGIRRCRRIYCHDEHLVSRYRPTKIPIETDGQASLCPRQAIAEVFTPLFFSTRSVEGFIKSFRHVLGHVISGGKDGHIYVWNVSTGFMIFGPMSGHTRAVLMMLMCKFDQAGWLQANRTMTRSRIEL